jgi:hypothetical protein
MRQVFERHIVGTLGRPPPLTTFEQAERRHEASPVLAITHEMLRCSKTACPNDLEMPFHHRTHSRSLWRFGWTYRASSNDDAGNRVVRNGMSQMKKPSIMQPKPRVVIVGAGFGGLSAAKALAGTAFEITLIDRHNYHLFQPLLYQVATAGLSPADIAAPIRGILRGQKNITVVLAAVSGVDTARREVLAEGRHIPFDFLVLATGAQHAYFGHDDWAPYAPGLKTIDDATYLRRRILLAFERAEAESDPAERKRLLSFVVVGEARPAWRWQVPSPNSPIAHSPPTSIISIRVPRGSFWSKPARGCLRRLIRRSPSVRHDPFNNSA